VPLMAPNARGGERRVGGDTVAKAASGSAVRIGGLIEPALEFGTLAIVLRPFRQAMVAQTAAFPKTGKA